MMLQNPGKYFGTDQFNNYDNMMAHYHGTGEEIWQQTGGAVTMVGPTDPINGQCAEEATLATSCSRAMSCGMFSNS